MNKYQTSDKTSYSLGMSLSIEAILNKAEYIKDIILSNKAYKNQQLQYLLDLCNKNNLNVIYDDEIIDKLSFKENCYCIAIFEKFYHALNDDKHLVLYRFNDLGQLGTIIRSAVSFDFKDIVLIDCDVDYFDPACIRASMGAIFHCNIKRYSSIDLYLDDYNHHHIYSFVSKSDKELSTLKIDKPFSVLISQDYYDLDDMDGYYLEHYNNEEISLSIRSSIILEKIFSIKS